MATPPPDEAGSWPSATEPAERPPMTSGRFVDIVVSVLLWIGLTLGSLVLGAVSPLLIMVGDGCVGEPDDPLVCEAGGSLLLFGGIGLLWLLLLAGVLFSAFRMVRAAGTGRPLWPWPFAGAGIGALGVVLLGVVLTVVVS